jgi:dihydroneopterin aldolase
MAEARFDRIRIRGWEVACILGVHAHERLRPRTVCIDLTLALTAEERHDDLARTVDYDALQQAIRREVELSSYKLIESLAEAIVAIALREPRVVEVTVCVGKPGALPGARTVEVEISRNRGVHPS